jgi:hypothetical protein
MDNYVAGPTNRVSSEKKGSDRMAGEIKDTRRTKITREPVSVQKDPEGAKDEKNKEDSGVFGRLAKKAGKGAVKGVAKELSK